MGACQQLEKPGSLVTEGSLCQQPGHRGSIPAGIFVHWASSTDINQWNNWVCRGFSRSQRTMQKIYKKSINKRVRYNVKVKVCIYWQISFMKLHIQNNVLWKSREELSKKGVSQWERKETQGGKGQRNLVTEKQKTAGEEQGLQKESCKVLRSSCLWTSLVHQMVLMENDPTVPTLKKHEQASGSQTYLIEAMWTERSISWHY